MYTTHKQKKEQTNIWRFFEGIWARSSESPKSFFVAFVNYTFNLFFLLKMALLNKECASHQTTI